MMHDSKGTRWVSCAIRIVFLLLVVSGAWLQAQTGAVTGHVKDTSGAVIPNVSITLTDQNGQSQKTVAESDGSFVFHSVAPGTYTVSAEYQGLTQNGVVAVTVAGSHAAQAEVVMKPEGVKQTVNVVEDTPNQVSVDPSSNADSLVIKGSDLEALPDDPDDLQQDLQALAGPSAGPNGGEIYVDGFSSGRLPPKESIREIRINQNPFAPEFDKLGFGRIEIFTKPGSDKFHGTAFYDISDGIWNARNPFIVSSPFPSFRAQTAGGNVSGPITKNASFFFDFERRL
ncbi:MAG: carboxypeptidase regulatory-like domain-containing protein, partial [Acidobacteriaceae bacterium]|nr:carboxypeptidase regulatory-like domain-containing protein [Acidobacteriaceae bacterium]